MIAALFTIWHSKTWFGAGTWVSVLNYSRDFSRRSSHVIIFMVSMGQTVKDHEHWTFSLRQEQFQAVPGCQTTTDLVLHSFTKLHITHSHIHTPWAIVSSRFTAVYVLWRRGKSSTTGDDRNSQRQTRTLGNGWHTHPLIKVSYIQTI